MKSIAGSKLLGWFWPLTLLAVCAVEGCVEPPPKTILSRGAIVARYNENAAKIPRLWARAQMDIRFPHDNRTIWLTPSGTLHLSKGDDRLGPQDFALIARESGQEVFRVGSSTADDAYYFWTHFGDNSTALYGAREFAGAPGQQTLPIDPYQLLSVLCVTELPDDFTRPPTVVMTMDDTPGRYAYVLVYIDSQPVTNRLFARREIYFRWSDTIQPRPYMIKYFDNQGRRVMVATLGNYQPIQMRDVENPPAAAPEMPTDIEIVWPNTDARIRLSLSEMTTKDVDPDLFLFWDRLPPGMRSLVRSVDEDAPQSQSQSAPGGEPQSPATGPAIPTTQEAK